MSPFQGRPFKAIPLHRIILSTLIPILLAVGYQRFQFGRHDRSNCRALLRDGRWHFKLPANSMADAFDQWDPTGCRILKYTSDDIHDCLGGRKVVFAGDSTTRQIFWGLAARLGEAKMVEAKVKTNSLAGKHESMSFDAHGVQLEFLWDPWLNSTELRNTLSSFEHISYTGVEGPSQTENDPIPREHDPLALVVLGAPGLWAAHQGGEEYFDIFKSNVDRAIGQLSMPIDERLVNPTISASNNYRDALDMVLIAPVQVPAYEKLSPDRAATMKPVRINTMNAYLSNVTTGENTHIIWAFNQMVKSGIAFEDNGLHVVDAVAERQADLVLNARCNGPAAGRRDSRKSTCCAEYPRGHFETAILLVGFSLSIPRLLYRTLPGSWRGQLRQPEFIAAMGQLFFALAWCNFSDRTAGFTKMARHYTPGPFVMLVHIWIATSFLTTGPVALDDSTPFSSGFLSRQQSEEIKGLMQAVILLYHYTHGSQVRWVYVLVRSFVSMYFFLSAYGHSTFFLRKQDFSFGRVAAVLFRVNALAALLPYAMNTDYIAYYFAPVITFWYLVVYFTLRTYSSLNNKELSRLFFKVGVAAVFVNLLILTPGILELASRASYAIFRMSWDAEELRFRLKIDRFIVFIGIVVAGIAQRVTQLRAQYSQERYGPFRGRSVHEESCTFMGPLDDMLQDVAEGREKWFYLLKPVALLICVMMIPLFFLIPLSGWVDTKEQYNALHPYISWLPIVAFLAFRNAHPRLRRRHLRLPAALGRIALETYLLQYHMWLGDDATSHLTTGLFTAYMSPWRARWFTGIGRLVETVVLTVFFLAVATSTHRATVVLSQWLFGPSYGRDRYGRRSAWALPIHSHVRECHNLERRSSPGPNSSSGSSDSETLSGAGQLFEMEDLNGRGRREAAASTSSSITDLEGMEMGGCDNINLESDNEIGARRDSREKKKRLLPEVLVRVRTLTARTPRLTEGLRRYRINATFLVEDPKPRALVLVSLLWLANWFYC